MLPCRYRAACHSARFERAALGKTTIPPLPCSGPSPPRTDQNREAASWPMYRASPTAARNIDIDRFSGIARSGQSFGYDQCDWLTDVPDLAERERGARRVVPRRTVTIDQRNCAGHVAETVCP